MDRDVIVQAQADHFPRAQIKFLLVHAVSFAAGVAVMCGSCRQVLIGMALPGAQGNGGGDAG